MNKWQVGGSPFSRISNLSLLYSKQTWTPEAAVSEDHALMNRNESFNSRGVAIRAAWVPDQQPVLKSRTRNIISLSFFHFIHQLLYSPLLDLDHFFSP
jgi:hypothetical protein